MQLYSEIIIYDEAYHNARGQAEKVCQQQWATKYLDSWFANRNVPFKKPLYEIACRVDTATWASVLQQLALEQESYKSFFPLKICPTCGRHTTIRKFNFTETNGCFGYSNGTCLYGKTYYYKETLSRIDLINKLVPSVLKDKLIRELCKSGPNGLPDIVGIAGGVLYFVEVKDIYEKLSQEQIHWLNWLGKFKDEGMSFLIRVTSNKPKPAVHTDAAR